MLMESAARVTVPLGMVRTWVSYALCNTVEVSRNQSSSFVSYRHPEQLGRVMCTDCCVGVCNTNRFRFPGRCSWTSLRKGCLCSLNQCNQCAAMLWVSCTCFKPNDGRSSLVDWCSQVCVKVLVKSVFKVLSVLVLSWVFLYHVSPCWWQVLCSTCW